MVPHFPQFGSASVLAVLVTICNSGSEEVLVVVLAEEVIVEGLGEEVQVVHPWLDVHCDLIHISAVPMLIIV
jgi:hypothetical protein